MIVFKPGLNSIISAETSQDFKLTIHCFILRWICSMRATAAYEYVVQIIIQLGYEHSLKTVNTFGSIHNKLLQIASFIICTVLGVRFRQICGLWPQRKNAPAHRFDSWSILDIANTANGMIVLKPWLNSIIIIIWHCVIIIIIRDEPRF